MSGIETLSYTMLLRRSSRSFSSRQNPIRLASLATFPTRGRLCVRNSGTLTNAVLAFCANKNRSARTGFAERFWFYYSTVTDFARFLGLSTSFPLLIEV